VPDWFSQRGDGFDLHVRLTPKASADRVDGAEKDTAGRAHLAVRVRAVPEKGAANTALERLLAERLSLPRSTVRVVAGQTARLKKVRVAGDADDLAARIGALASPGTSFP
jgi:uncharacterized protein YggU (UPF0235/DUF167 family)